jgi:hypothetical protein
MIYNFSYKCRMCGEVFQQGSFEGTTSSMVTTIGRVFLKNTSQQDHIPSIIVHKCARKIETSGVADLIGHTVVSLPKTTDEEAVEDKEDSATIEERKHSGEFVSLKTAQQAFDQERWDDITSHSYPAHTDVTAWLIKRQAPITFAGEFELKNGSEGIGILTTGWSKEFKSAFPFAKFLGDIVICQMGTAFNVTTSIMIDVANWARTFHVRYLPVKDASSLVMARFEDLLPSGYSYGDRGYGNSREEARLDLYFLRKRNP